MHIFKNTNYDFLRWRVHALVLSWVVILAGLVVLFTRGMPLGLEFAGGTQVILEFEQPPSVEQVRTALDKNYPGGGQNTVVQLYGDPARKQVLVRVPQVGAESGNNLSTTAQQVEDALKKGNIGNFKRAGAEIVSPTVGKELTSRGTWATVLSLIGILIYIAFRFQFSFGVGAVVATIHDLLVTLAFLVFFRYDLSLNVIAAILTMSGYSTNDTIVIFDRVRENLRSMRRDSMHDIINRSVNQTLGRTVLTGGLTLLTMVALFLFGGEVLRGFAFTMIVGIITGTYSSVFIAAAIVSFWGASATRAAAHAPTTPTSTSARPGGLPPRKDVATVGTGQSQQPARKTKPQRKARAS